MLMSCFGYWHNFWMNANKASHALMHPSPKCILSIAPGHWSQTNLHQFNSWPARFTWVWCLCEYLLPSLCLKLVNGLVPCISVHWTIWIWFRSWAVQPSWKMHMHLCLLPLLHTHFHRHFLSLKEITSAFHRKTDYWYVSPAWTIKCYILGFSMKKISSEVTE